MTSKLPLSVLVVVKFQLVFPPPKPHGLKSNLINLQSVFFKQVFLIFFPFSFLISFFPLYSLSCALPLFSSVSVLPPVFSLTVLLRCVGAWRRRRRGGGFSSPIPCRATLSWGKDDRKSARWHRAGLQHVTSSLERQEARRRRGGRSEDEDEEGD